MTGHLVPFPANVWIYDLESYPNVFTASFKHPLTGTRRFFAATDWENNLDELWSFLSGLRESGCQMVGFNNVGYDYPMLHHFLTQYHPGINGEFMYWKNAAIIATPWNDRFSNVIWERDRLIPQVDLFLIHHFDNEAKRTSLKMLEFNMRSPNIEDLPFPPGTALTGEQTHELIRYNNHDVDETEKFWIETLPQIEFRQELTKRYGQDYTNFNDTKIGEQYFIRELEDRQPGSCYIQVDGRRVVRQTCRDQIDLSRAVFPYIQFERPEFQRVRNWLANQVITETKGVFLDLTATVNGFEYVFGAGGIHGSVESQTVASDDEYVIYDWDVASYYPNLAIANRIYPEHLGELFCDVYLDVFEQRKHYPKGSPENAMLKLALNGVYGKTNSEYSPFYDPLYTMSITINGQLLLCMLAEQLIKIPNLSVIQINTDGITVRLPRVHVDHMNTVCQWWQDFTKLTLESVVYRRMFIRDVNNYIAETDKGKLKRKGAYCYGDDLGWHQNQSFQIVAMAAEEALVFDVPIEVTIMGHGNLYNFMGRTKVGRADNLILQQHGHTIELQRICRYYVSDDGGSMFKISPPVQGSKIGQWKRANGLTDGFYRGVLVELALVGGEGPLDSTGVPWDERIHTKNRSVYNERRTAVESCHLVTPCNDISVASFRNLDYTYYINEARKLVEPLRKST